MNPQEVTLIGVVDPDGETWCYTVDAPTNLWVGEICRDGSRMSIQFMAHMLNGLIEADGFHEGATYEVRNQDGVVLRAVVGEEVLATSVEAYQSLSDTVRTVTVSVVSTESSTDG
jgi:hypothetical protein